MSDMRQNCPSNWTAGDINGIRGCRQRNPSLYSCKSTFYPTNILYSNIYGRILGYARGTPDAFANSVIDGYTSIEEAYVDGVSLTHGNPGSRQHIWTFAAALSETIHFGHQAFVCRCNSLDLSWRYNEPAYVGRDYFCDIPKAEFLLWSSQGCGQQNRCCEFSDPPWFNTTLPEMTDDDLEVRLCLGHPPNDEDLLISLIEMYVS